MLTRNFYVSLCAISMLPTNASSGQSLSVRIPSGNYGVLYGSGSGSGTQLATQLSLVPSYLNNLRFGTNDADESSSDYNIAEVTLTKSMSSTPTPSYDESTKRCTLTQRYVLNNSQSSSVTIKEFGVYSYVKTATNSLSSVLIYRKKLDESFILQPNETVNFDLTVIYEMPSEYEPYSPV